MTSVIVTPNSILQVCEEIEFLKKEINFFLKIMQKQYQTTFNYHKVKVLDAVWKDFELYLKELNEINFSLQTVEESVEDFSEPFQKVPAIKLICEMKSRNKLNVISKKMQISKSKIYGFISEP
jgi:hypothetical protein